MKYDQKRTIDAMNAPAHSSLAPLFKSQSVNALVIPIEANLRTVKMRDYKLVIDAVKSALEVNSIAATILCGVVNRNGLPDDVD